MRLQDLDDAIVPRAAVALRRLVDGTAARARALRPGVSPSPSTSPAAPAGPLRRLDDRYTSTGPLALVREVPQVGYFVLALLLLVAAGVALVRSQDDAAGRSRSGSSVSVDPDDPAAVPPLLGPQLGVAVDTYVRDADAELAAAADDDGGRRYVALVSFETYQKADGAAPLLDGVAVRQVYLRVPLKTGVPELLTPEVKDLLPDLAALQAATAARKGNDGAEFQRLAESIEPKSKEEETFKSFYAAAAKTAASEAAEFRKGCTCLFGAVVEGDAEKLAELGARPGVRVVELAPRGLRLDALSLSPPLLPGTKGVVVEIASQAGVG